MTGKNLARTVIIIRTRMNDTRVIAVSISVGV
jgi:hypothetical protein